MFVLPDLPYAADALEPVISARTLGFHHGKHHRTYVETLNTLLAEAGHAPVSLEEVVRDAAGDAAKAKLFNNAAQAWNHAFFWDCMSPERQSPSGELAEAIDAADTLPRDGVTPLLVCDLWEHAYYLDHQNDRKGYLESWFDALPNWSLAASQLAAARGRGEVWPYPKPV